MTQSKNLSIMDENINITKKYTKMSLIITEITGGRVKYGISTKDKWKLLQKKYNLVIVQMAILTLGWSQTKQLAVKF